MFLQKIKLFLSGVIVFMLMTEIATAGTVADSKTVNLEIMVLAPPCNITSPAQVDIGNVEYNSQKDGPQMNIEINCDYPVYTKAVASLLNTDLVDETTAAMMSVQSGTASGALLRIFETTGNYNKFIKLTGNDSDAFCHGSQIRTCTFIPKLSTGTAGITNGPVRAMIKFDVIYS